MSDNPETQREPVRYEAWEERGDWPHIVAEEVTTHKMLPRDAKAILRAAGEAMAKGVPLNAVVKAVKSAKE